VCIYARRVIKGGNIPYKPKKPCAYPGCPALTHERYCEAHQKVVDKQYNQFQRDKGSQAFYESAAWRRLRRIKLQANPLCEVCLKEKATTADHIIPMKQGGAALDIANLQGLCAACHGRKSIQEGSRFGKR